MTSQQSDIDKIMIENEDLAKANRQGNPINAIRDMKPDKVRKLQREIGVKRGNKYGAVRTWSELCGRMFDSKAEARRGEYLGMLQEGGVIKHLDYQIRFVLCDSPKITVTLDFKYIEGENTIYEDCKGVLTRDSRTKYAWLKEKYGIEVKLVK